MREEGEENEEGEREGEGMCGELIYAAEKIKAMD